MLHHDAITGTHSEHVNIDYKDMIESANSAIDGIVDDIQSELYRPKNGENTNSDNEEFRGTNFFKVNENEKLENNFYSRTISNPSLYARHEIMNITITESYVEIYDEKGKKVDAEVIPEYGWDFVDRISRKIKSQVFFYVELPPLSVKKYIIYEHSSRCSFCSINV
jgi:hypothetical protein